MRAALVAVIRALSTLHDWRDLANIHSDSLAERQRRDRVR